MLSNTSENKARYFALYYGQNVAWCKNSADDYQLFRVLTNTMVDEVEHLKLRGLDTLTDAEAIEVAKISFPNSDSRVHTASFGRALAGRQSITRGDYLRSISIALPYMSIPVSTLIEWGWCVVNGEKGGERV